VIWFDRSVVVALQPPALMRAVISKAVRTEGAGASLSLFIFGSRPGRPET